jgi:hypothetical protein
MVDGIYGAPYVACVIISKAMDKRYYIWDGIRSLAMNCIGQLLSMLDRGRFASEQYPSLSVRLNTAADPQPASST